MTSAQPSLVIFTGGSAFNPTAYSLRQLGHRNVDYIVPTTDDGGSSLEILRYFGGPAVGDLRSRLLRLASESTSEARAIKNMLQHRLPGQNTTVPPFSTTTTIIASDDPSFAVAKTEWHAILHGTHHKWTALLSDEFKCTVLRFLHYFEQCVLDKRRQSPHLGHFDYRNGSIGNFFFSGARLFFGSMAAAIFWWSRVAGIPDGSRVIPAASSYPNPEQRSAIESLTVGAVIQNDQGTTYDVIGQCEISHPTVTNGHGKGKDTKGTGSTTAAATVDTKGTGSTTAAATAATTTASTNAMATNSSGTKRLRIDVPTTTTTNNCNHNKNHPAITSPRIMATIKNSSGLQPFDSFNGRITQLYHVARPSNSRVVSPPGNPKAVRSLATTDCVCYGIGSLFTSIIAGILPIGNGSAVLSNTKALKVLILNGGQDRETYGFSIQHYVEAVYTAST